MSRTRHQGRRDANHGEIVAAFRHIGYTVLDLGAVGDGCPDICVGKFGYSHLVEIKTEEGRLTSDQQEFKQVWEGNYDIVRSIEDVLELSAEWFKRMTI